MSINNHARNVYYYYYLLILHDVYFYLKWLLMIYCSGHGVLQYSISSFTGITNTIKFEIHTFVYAITFH